MTAGLFTLLIASGGSGVAIAQDVAASGKLLEEIVVTARKRQESIQEVPISMVAFTAQDLEDQSIVWMEQVIELVPNVTLARGFGGGSHMANVFIRGVGQIDFLASFDPGAGIYIDGVYLGRMQGGLLDLLDVGTIEVLRGPQGTLFGKNTVAGAISVNTKRPSADETSWQVQASLGSYERRDLRATINLPLVEGELAMRASAAYQNRDGYGQSLWTGQKQGGNEDVSAKLSLAYTPSDNFAATLALDTLSSDYQPISKSIIAMADGALVDLYNATVAVPVYGFAFDDSWFTGNPFTNYDNWENAENSVDVWGVSLTLDWNLGPASLKSITAYRDQDTPFGLDYDSSPLPMLDAVRYFVQDQLSQEFQLSGLAMDGNLDWVVGLYYFEEDGLETTDLRLLSGTYDAIGLDLDAYAEFGYENQSWAAFAHMSYAFNDRWSMSLGARYTDEERKLPIAFATAPNAGIVTVDASGSSGTYDAFTPKVSAEYRYSDASMLYASYSEGFRSGGINGRFNEVVMGVPYEPEFSKAYEIGVKTDSAGGRLRTNAAVFFTDFEDMHGVVPVCNASGVCSGAVQNAAKAEIKGLELELAAIPTERLELTLGLGYVDPKFVEIDPEATDITLDSPFPMAPDWTIVGGAQYRFPLGSGAELSFRADANYKSEHVLGFGTSASIENDGFTLVDARVAYASPGKQWDVALYGKNLTDEEYYTSGVAFIPIGIGFDYAVFGRPREWGITFNYYAGD